MSETKPNSTYFIEVSTDYGCTILNTKTGAKRKLSEVEEVIALLHFPNLNRKGVYHVYFDRLIKGIEPI